MSLLPPMTHKAISLSIRWIAIAFICGSLPARAQDQEPEVVIIPPDVHLDIAKKVRRKHRVPAIALAVVRNGEPPRIAATGVRRARGRQKVTVHDKWHLGSCTKSMTATMCAMLVEKGKLSWDSTPAQVLPDLSEKMHPRLREVTLVQLLSHRAGFPDDHTPNLGLWIKIMALSGDLSGQRRSFVGLVMGPPPTHEPGAEFAYSNFGYAIAGAMSEAVTGRSYEELMQTMLFGPLGMSSAGFGAPGTRGKLDEPLGHDKVLGIYVPVEPGVGADNPAVIAPAGTVHCSIGDWARYAALHLAAASGQPRMLKSETFSRLHEDIFKQDYAMGWATGERPWAAGKVLVHDGSNRRWYAVIVIAPRRDLAFMVATNAADQIAQDACAGAIEALKKHYAPISVP